MERNRSGKVIAIVALLLGVAGLSLGFAAFSSTLRITSEADVLVDESVWNVGFSNNTSAVATTTVQVTGKDENNADDEGVIDLTQFVISQNTNATLQTVNGSKVEYDFYIVNDGKLAAYLNSVTMGTLSCAYRSTNRNFDGGASQVTPSSGTISNADCATLFTATLTLNSSSTFTSGSAAVTSGFNANTTLAKPNPTPTYIPAKLTIAYNNGSIDSVTAVPDGDFTVSLSDSTVVYASTQPGSGS